jgi:AraC-like DNA-binding protein
MNLDFNPRSAILLVALVQGIVFTLLLLRRWRNERQNSDIFLAGLIFFLTASLTDHFIGFLGIYDRYPVIRFFPFENFFTYCPLILLYVESILIKGKRLGNWAFFVPAVIYFVFHFIVFCLSNEAKETFANTVYFPFIIYVEYSFYYGLSFFLLHKTIQLLRQHASVINENYSNISAETLRWLKVFLYAFFVYLSVELIFNVIAAFNRFSFAGWWWIYFIRACFVYYLCVAGYGFKEKVAVAETELNNEKSIEKRLITDPDKQIIQRIINYLVEQKPYLNEELTLTDLANKLRLTPNQLSFLVNSGIGKNFNDWINEYRVNEVIELMKNPAKRHLNLLGMATESGFNSKTTFNRVFKKVTGKSPSEFYKQIPPSSD